MYILFVRLSRVFFEFEYWDERLPVGDVDADFIIDLERILDCFWHMSKKFLHFPRATQGIVSFYESWSIGIFESASIADTEKEISRLSISLVHVVDVIGCDDFMSVRSCYLDEGIIDFRLIRTIRVFLELEVKILLTEESLIICDTFSDKIL